MISRLLPLLFLALTGCYDIYPCNGGTVLVEPSELLDYVGHDTIRAGLHVWDVYGCRYRAKDELTEFELSRVSGPVLHIEEWYETSKDWAGMYYSAYPSRIMVSPNIFEDKFPIPCATQTIAHETGHAMGMDHIYPPDGGQAIMQPVQNCLTVPTKYDYDAWCRLWCGKMVDTGGESN